MPVNMSCNPAMTPTEILAKLRRGRVAPCCDYSRRAHHHPNCRFALSTDSRIAQNSSAWRKTRLSLRRLGSRRRRSEGYLYPDTYKFPRPDKAKEVLVAMVEQLRQMVGPDLRARMQELKMTMHEVLTLASVIEKETGSGDERPQISAVFHNRLKKHIPLQSDPTVIYGLPNSDGNLQKKDLSIPVPTIPIGGRDCRLDRLPTQAFRRFCRALSVPILAHFILSPGTMEHISSLRRSSSTTRRWRNIRSGPSVAEAVPTWTGHLFHSITKEHPLS